MLVKDIIFEDFVNYKYPCMFIGTCYCTWKCCLESNIPIEICQNYKISKQDSIEVSTKELYALYISNPITSAICFGGLEPMMQFDEIIETIKYFRDNGCDDTFLIYTGYYLNEITEKINNLKQFNNIIVKFGRYITNQKPHYDQVLGVYLVSDNQYAVKIS